MPAALLMRVAAAAVNGAARAGSFTWKRYMSNHPSPRTRVERNSACGTTTRSLLFTAWEISVKEERGLRPSIFIDVSPEKCLPSDALLYSCEADLMEIGVSLVFLGWRSHVVCCAVKHCHLRREHGCSFISRMRTCPPNPAAT